MADPLYLTYSEMFFLLLFNIVGSFVVAFFVYLFIEKPISNFIAELKSNKYD
jgi:peptidoglycan/LPS O-acetylase OafA/YrhL